MLLRGVHSQQKAAGRHAHVTVQVLPKAQDEDVKLEYLHQCFIICQEAYKCSKCFFMNRYHDKSAFLAWNICLSFQHACLAFGSSKPASSKGYRAIEEQPALTAKATRQEGM